MSDDDKIAALLAQAESIGGPWRNPITGEPGEKFKPYKAIEVVPPNPEPEPEPEMAKPEPADKAYVGKQAIKVVARNESQLSEQQKTSVIFFAYQMHLSGEAITAKEIEKAWPKSGLKLKAAGPNPGLEYLDHYLHGDDFRDRMAKRGVDIGDNSLSAEQIAFLQVLTGTGGGSLENKLKRAGIKRSVWRAWLRQEAFNTAYRNLAGKTLEDAIPAAQIALADKATKGDMNAIKFIHEVTGKYRSSGAVNQADAEAKVREMVNVVLQAVTNNVRDPEVLAAIQRDIQFQARSIGATQMLG